MTNQEDSPFGAELYEAFRAAGRLDFVTRRFNYDAIQRLKKADREHTLKLFQGASWAILQRLKADTPQQVVEYCLEQERQQAIAISTAAMSSAISPFFFPMLP
ncbi:MAG: hypothetical protein WDZ51_09400 [Pirellulaceae bacterium]